MTGEPLTLVPAAPPTVLVAVGTDHHRFDRLVSWADAWAEDARGSASVIVQTGTSSPPKSCAWQPYFEHAELSGLMGRASAFACHGGPGTISEARGAGFVPIVVPRRRALKEHVDDHQVRFCERLARSGYVFVAHTEEDFARLLNEALHGSPSRRSVPGVGSPTAAVARFAEAADALLASRAGRHSAHSDPDTLVRQ